jgi:predicted nuclease of predicted toxin-antitoxin system
MRKALLDENLPKQLKKYFSTEFDVTSVPDLGWQSKKNGELLTALDEAEFHYLITVDKSLRYQQNLEKFKVRIVVLLTFDNRLKNLISKIGFVETKIKEADESDKVVEIDLRGL